MALSLKHLFQSAKADGTDATLVKPTNWNAEHNMVTDSAVPVVLGATGPGPITDIPVSTIMPTAVVVPYAGATAPAGFLLCFGQPVSRITYANLFAVIGTTYGTGDGSTTFNVPDLRGAAAGGKSNMGGADRGNLPGGATLGGYLGVPTVGGLPVSVNVSGNISGSTSGAQYFAASYTTDGGNQAQFGGIVGSGDVAHGYHNHSGSVEGWTQGQALTVGGSFSGSGSGGTTVAFNVIQPTVVLNYIIKT